MESAVKIFSVDAVAGAKRGDLGVQKRGELPGVYGGEMIQGIAMAVAEELGRHDIAVTDQERIARECAGSVQERFGGAHTYVPTGVHHTRKAVRSGELAGDLMQLIAEDLEGRLRRLGVGDDEVLEVARQSAEAVRRFIGCGHQYIPNGKQDRYEERNASIWNEFTGANYGELSRKHHLTEMRIRQIVQLMRARSRKTK
ncbi:MAG: hypothetical protein C0607_14915 [Azoarcus sp.]|nr:MAG: hypothetical protein C0607_14915 [Azoarcus sp.]